MNEPLFTDFLSSKDVLRVYDSGKLVFSSELDGLRPLLEYTEKEAPAHKEVVIFDKVAGNAAALLSIRVGCQEVFSPLGSRVGVQTLNQYGITHHIDKLVDYILQDNGVDMCPMEKLSLGKDPETFYQAISATIKVKR